MATSAGIPAAERTSLYPPIEPFNHGRLRVGSGLHELYYEEVGVKGGQPAVFLHGGPGGGISATDRQYFDPKAYHVVLFDQRGAGKSTPSASLEENTTWDLVEDIEALRKHVGIEKWIVFGGSWGSTLALSYAEKYPERVKALVLRGIFGVTRPELLWFYQEGASWIFPDVWEEYLAPIPEVERGDLMSAYYRRLTGSDEVERNRCAAAWTKWECSTSRLLVDPDMVKKASDDIWAYAFARIECHFFVHGGWFKSANQLIDEAHKIAHIPTTIVQGRYDLVCPAKTAWELKKGFLISGRLWVQSLQRLNNAELFMMPTSGHSAREPEIASKLVEACNKYRDLP